MRVQLAKDGIEARSLWKPIHLQPVFKKHPYYGGSVAEQLFQQGLCLPSGAGITDEDRERILNSIMKFQNS